MTLTHNTVPAFLLAAVMLDDYHPQQKPPHDQQASTNKLCRSVCCWTPKQHVCSFAFHALLL